MTDTVTIVFQADTAAAEAAIERLTTKLAELQAMYRLVQEAAQDAALTEADDR